MNDHSHVMPTADNFTIWIALAAAVCAFVGYLILAISRGKRGADSPIGRYARIAYYVCFASIASSSLYLLQCILSGNRFDIAYIYDNSSKTDTLLYRISSFWAGQGGSLLLWALMAAVIGVFLLRKLERTSPALMSFWCSIQAFFLVVMVVDDPLRKLEGFQMGMGGAGLNPLLKNPWMAIHPPVIFLGYALLAVPAALAVQALMDRDASRWAKRCLPWAIGGWVAMTVGLVLGMVWSYEVLGWGGYWGWDPVENASLVPWLISTVLVHGLVLQRHRARMARWNIFLAFVTFLSVMYATFLTRSGILSDVSVHSFGRTPAFGWLVGFPIAYAVFCFGLLIAKRTASASAKPMKTDSREFVLTLGLVVLSLFAVVVLLGTTVTTFYKRSSIDPGFYAHMSIPLCLAILALIAFSPLLKWGGESTAARRRFAVMGLGIVFVAAIAGIAVSLAAPGAKMAIFGSLLPEGSAGTLIAVPLVLLLLGWAVVALASSAGSLGGSTFIRNGALIAHSGVALLVLGVVLSTAGRTKVIELKMGGHPAEAFGYRFSYVGRDSGSDGTERMRLLAEDRGHRIDVSLRMADTARGTIRFPYIYSSALRDLYISPEEAAGKSVQPMLSMTGNGWISHPADVPGSDAKLGLLGMQVESHLATLIYEKPGSKPVRFEVSTGHPKTIDGYTFSFNRFLSNGAENMAQVTAGADIGIRGRGFAETAVVRVSRKPFISLLWLGTMLITLGGVMALIRRRKEKVG